MFYYEINMYYLFVYIIFFIGFVDYTLYLLEDFVREDFMQLLEDRENVPARKR